MRLPLDVALVFSANPEDYTARGKIITPLKDRIGAEIQTHYPANVQLSSEIRDLELVDYKVRILNGGTEAITYVLIQIARRLRRALVDGWRLRQRH